MQRDIAASMMRSKRWNWSMNLMKNDKLNGLLQQSLYKVVYLRNWLLTLSTAVPR
jgi:hypothetical protein